MQELYKILNLEESATDEEIETAYKTLKEKYSKERFLEGDAGNNAAKKLTQLENAYAEIKAERKNSEKNNYSEVEKHLKEGKIAEAQSLLDQVSVRDAEWHYLQSVVFYKKNWINESKKQLEIAMSIEPKNKKYSEAYTKLKQKIEYNEKQFQSGNAAPKSEQVQPDYGPSQQMGGSGVNDCCNWCATMCCMNLACNLCCQC